MADRCPSRSISANDVKIMGDSVSSETLSWVLSHFTGIRKLFLRGVIGHGMDNAIDSHDVKNMVSRQSVCNILCV